MDKLEAFSALTDLIFKGFLTSELKLDGKLLIFKTVTEKEFELIKMYSGRPSATDYQTRFNVYFLIFSLFMLNNQNMLCDREKNIPELYDYFFQLPDKLLRKMLIELNKVRTISFESIKYLEGFCYTNQARSAWKALNGNPPCSMEFTGIPGTQSLGSNIHQESWVLINKSLDDEESYNKEFSLFLMVASASNPKGARQIRTSFEASKKMSEDRRAKLADEGIIDTRKWTPEGWAAPVDTAEELVAELERQMTGKKDKHDLLITEFIEKSKEQAALKVQEAQDRIKKAQEGRDNVLIDGDQRAMTFDEMEALKHKNYQTLKTDSEETVSSEDKQNFLSKIGNRVLTGR